MLKKTFLVIFCLIPTILGSTVLPPTSVAPKLNSGEVTDNQDDLKANKELPSNHVSQIL